MNVSTSYQKLFIYFDLKFMQLNTNNNQFTVFSATNLHVKISKENMWFQLQYPGTKGLTEWKMGLYTYLQKLKTRVQILFLGLMLSSSYYLELTFIESNYFEQYLTLNCQQPSLTFLDCIFNKMKIQWFDVSKIFFTNYNYRILNSIGYRFFRRKRHKSINVKLKDYNVWS